MNIDGLSLFPLIQECNTILNGGRIYKIFQPDKLSLVIWIRKHGQDYALKLSANPERPHIYIAELVPENPASPPAFCMLLRKHLEDGRIAKIIQLNLDRIVQIHIDIKDEKDLIATRIITIEMMGKHSNIIFSADDIIVDAIKHVGLQLSRVRQMLPGRPYTEPPNHTGLNILEVTADIFTSAIFAQNTETIEKAIIRSGIGLGPTTAREILFRASLQPQSYLTTITESHRSLLINAIDSIVIPLKEGKFSPTVVLDSEENILTLASFPLHSMDNQKQRIFPTMNTLANFCQTRKNANTFNQNSYKKIISNELTKLLKKQSQLTEDLLEAEQADLIRKQADLLMAFLHQIKKGALTIELPDLFSLDATQPLITIALSPERTPIENAQRLYNKYNKLKRACSILIQQSLATQQEIEYFQTLELALDQASSSEDVQDLRQELITIGLIHEKVSKKPPALAKPLQFTTPTGDTIWVGKNNRQNDLLTFKIAQSDDYWFHTKNIPGSHVVLRPVGAIANNDSIYIAAMLAAFYSKAKNSATVPVDYTKRRYVKKPSGAKPGFVIFDHQTTVYVTPDEQKIKDLL